MAELNAQLAQMTQFFGQQQAQGLQQGPYNQALSNSYWTQSNIATDGTNTTMTYHLDGSSYTIPIPPAVQISNGNWGYPVADPPLSPSSEAWLRGRVDEICWAPAG